jgi:hypothetical protein
MALQLVEYLLESKIKIPNQSGESENLLLTFSAGSVSAVEISVGRSDSK